MPTGPSNGNVQHHAVRRAAQSACSFDARTLVDHARVRYRTVRANSRDRLRIWLCAVIPFSSEASPWIARLRLTQPPTSTPNKSSCAVSQACRPVCWPAPPMPAILAAVGGRSFRVTPLVAWVLLLWLIAAARTILILQYRRATPAGRARSGWHRWMLISTTAAGVAWGGSVYFLTAEHPLHYELVPPVSSWEA